MVAHVFLDPTGDIHVNINQNGTVTSVPDDPTLPTFTGTFHSSETVNGPPGTLPGGEFTIIETVNGRNSDGTHAVLLMHQHVTWNANLVVTASFDTLTCSS